MRRSDAAQDFRDAGAWLRAVLLPLLFFVLAIAIICSLVLSGAVQGHRAYEEPARALTTQPTVIIQP